MWAEIGTPTLLQSWLGKNRQLVADEPLEIQK